MELPKIDWLGFINKIPILNLLPIFEDAAQYVPKAWESLSPEEKTQLIANALKLAAKGSGKVDI